MLRMGLDIGTGFVKCVSNYGAARFPSIYASRVHGSWTEKRTEAVGCEAQSILSTMGTTAISPIQRGRPDPRYQRAVEMLIRESVRQVCALAKTPVAPDTAAKIVVGLPYHAFDCRAAMAKTVKRVLNAKSCDVVAQASGTLVDLDRDSAVVVSIGQGTTEIVVIDELEVIDGDSSMWASSFVTRKIGRFAHMDVKELYRNRDVCKKYSVVLADNLIREIREMSAAYADRYPVALSGGGLLLPGVNEAMTAGLKGLEILIPDDPVMSNARGLYKLTE